MRKTFLIASGLVFAGLVGCQAPQQTPTDLNQRYTDAMAINDVAGRDDQLMKIAGDAANARNADSCLTSVSSINDHAKQDTTAQDCANTFNNNGDRQTANMLVEKINDPATKDKMHVMYARRPAPTPTTAPMPMMPH